MPNLKFLKTMLTDFWRVAMIMPSSKYVVDKILKQFKKEHLQVVEYGAGDGVVTKRILKYLPENGKITAIEINKNFLEDLRNIKDERLVVAGGDVLDVIKTIEKADIVVSGIPFTHISKKNTEKIVEQTANMLNKDGLFIVYQTTPMMLRVLRKYFSKTELFFEPRNLPPFFIMVGKK
ncbi:MAG: rRNA adenine N-6-methyltransferase family protein [Candidatus Paceibacterota bacterium]|jgi:phospholipid N-methyltransferase